MKIGQIKIFKTLEHTYKNILQKKPQDMSGCERLKYATCNLLEGYKPIFIKGKKKNGKQFLVKDTSHLPAVNWIKKTQKSNIETTEVKTWSGSKYSYKTDLRTGKKIEQTNFCKFGFLHTKYNDGIVENYSKRVENPYYSYYWVWKRNADGNFEKIINQPYPENQQI